MKFTRFSLALLGGLGLAYLLKPSDVQAQQRVASYSFSKSDERTAEITAYAKQAWNLDLHKCALTDVRSRVAFIMSHGRREETQFHYGIAPRGNQKNLFFLESLDGQARFYRGPSSYDNFAIVGQATRTYRLDGRSNVRVNVHGEAAVPGFTGQGLLNASGKVFFPTNRRGTTTFNLLCNPASTREE